MLLLFTRLRSDRPWYKRDLLNSCCLATGSYVQFGYKRRWVAEGLWNDAESARNEPVLLIFVEDRAPADGSQALPFRFHPVRFGVVREVHKDPAALSLDVELGDFFDYSERSDLEKSLDDFQTTVSAARDVPPQKFACRMGGEVANYRSKAWYPTVNHMRQRVGLDDAVFFCAEHVAESDKEVEKRSPFAFRQPEHGRECYALESGTEYRVSLRLVYGPKAAQVVPALIVSDLASSSGPFVQQRSAGAKVDFLIQVRRVLQPEIAMLSLRVGSPEDPYVSPELTALLRVRSRRFLLHAVSALVAFGTVLASVTEAQVASCYDFASVGYSWINPISVSWVAKAIGAGCVFVGAIQGFGTLPLKGG